MDKGPSWHDEPDNKLLCLDHHAPVTPMTGVKRGGGADTHLWPLEGVNIE